jgi:hypothetical protein
MDCILALVIGSKTFEMVPSGDGDCPYSKVSIRFFSFKLKGCSIFVNREHTLSQSTLFQNPQMYF